MKAVISNRIYLNRTKELHDFLLDELTYMLPPLRPNMPGIIECEVTRINNNILTIPSGRVDLIPKDYEIIDKRKDILAIFPKFKFTLRKTQQEVYDEVNDSCMIIANPSWGKTLTAIAIATKLKQKTIILVHTALLFNQWITEVKKTLGIDPGMIGQGYYKNLDSIITIGMKQSVENKIIDLKDNYGLLLVDECHHCVATVFKGIVDKFKCRYKIGMTATPWRKDGRQILLKDYFGLEEHNPPDENRLDPKIIIIESDIKINSSQTMSWAKKMTELYDNPDYIELIVNLSAAQVQRGFKVLTVAERVQFLKDCSEILENFLLIIGETKERDFLLKNKDGILGSQKIFSEGINIPELSSLVMATPINNRALLEQLIGRISRKHPDKINPEVIDISFLGYTAKNQLVQRINYYMNQGFEIKRI